MSGGEVRKVSPEDIQMVQNLIEQCLPHYMSQKQVVNALYQREKIEPSFTELVWQKLEEQNPEFFKGYYLRLMVKEQITEFNKLLERQVSVMHQVDPARAPFQPMPNGCRMPTMHQDTSCHGPENAGTLLKTENTQHPVTTSLPSGFGGPLTQMQRAVDMSGQTGGVDLPPNMLLAPHPNLAMIQAMNGGAVKTEAGYLGNSRFVYGADDNVMETRPMIGNPSFSGMEAVSHPLNRTLLDYNSSFGLLGSISHNFGLPDLTVDFPGSSEILDFSRPAFLPSDRHNFLDAHGSTVDDQGEDKRLDDLSGNLNFDDFGRGS